MKLRTLIFCFVIVLASLVPASAHAETSPIILSSKTGGLIDLKAEMDVYIDPRNALDIREVVDRSDEFKNVETKHLDFGLGDFKIWLRATLFNPENTPGIWRLDTGRPYTEELDIYVVKDGAAPELVFIHRASDKFSARALDKRTLTADLDIPAETVLDLYIAFRSSSTTSLAIDFGTPLAVTEEQHQETLVDITLNGILIAMLVLALMFVTMTGWRLSLAFAAYIVFGILYVAHADGYLSQYLWPNFSIKNDAINLLLMLLMSASGVNFGRVLFSFKDSLLGYDRFLAAFSLIALAFAGLAYFAIDLEWFMILAYLVIPIGTLIQPVTGLFAIRQNKRGAKAFLSGAILVLLAISYSVVAHIFPGQYDLDHTLDVGHLALVGETFAFAGAIVAMLLGIQQERDAAMSAELLATREKLAMSSALRDSQKQYVEAREISRQRREKLSSVSHDLQQPLASLRAIISKMALKNDDAGNQMHSALDYLEKLARDQIDSETKLPQSIQSDGVIDVFSVGVILQNIFEMFRSEAESKGIEFKLRSLEDNIQADAVSLMRVVSNLTKNAIRHTTAGRILLAARRREDHILIEIYDTGTGMTSDDVERFMRRREKSETSEGSGLGLSIVNKLSAQFDWKFSIASTPGHGTRARICVPRHH